MNRLLIYTLLLPLWVSSFPRYSAQTPSPDAVVHAVLFFSPACAHCQKVINDTLMPLFEQYGNQLSMVGIDITRSAGQELFRAALQYFNLETSGVPFLVIGDTYIVGSIKIPAQFPTMVEEYLAGGGVDWPSIPGLTDTLTTAQAKEAAAAPATTPTAVSAIAPAAPTATPGIQLTEEHSGLGAGFASDWAGNSLAVIVLVGMIFVSVQAVLSWRHETVLSDPEKTPANTWSWLIPALCVVGLGVAGYLSYVETAQVEAVCGPVGDCNTVQQSEYARLFGVLPIGILGMAGYILILLAWAGANLGKGFLASYASLALLILAAFGVLFSAYLTFLEPFVIGATCAWCLTSAIIMTALLWLSIKPATRAYRSLRIQI